jgi:hypothetical protein
MALVAFDVPKYLKNAALLPILVSLAGCAVPPEPGIANFSSPVFTPGYRFNCSSMAQCRSGPLHIVLMRDNGSVASRSIDRPLPYIAGAYATIYAGERLFLRTEVTAGQLKLLRAASNIDDPADMVIIQLRQPAYVNNGLYRGPGGMVMTVYNPFSSPLVYKAAILPADSTKPEPVSTCAVMPGTSSYEIWKVPVLLVWVTDLHLADRSGAIPCR